MTNVKQKWEIIMQASWLTTEQIAQIADCGYDKAKQIRDHVNAIIEQKGLIVFNKTKAPTKDVIAHIGLDLDFLEMQCK